jgi:hypothetical protein
MEPPPAVPAGYARTLAAIYTLCLLDLLLNGAADFPASPTDGPASDAAANAFLAVQFFAIVGVFGLLVALLSHTYLVAIGLLGHAFRHFRGALLAVVGYWVVFALYGSIKLGYHNGAEQASQAELWDRPLFVIASVAQKAAALLYYLAVLEATVRLGEPRWYQRKAWVAELVRMVQAQSSAVAAGSSGGYPYDGPAAAAAVSMGHLPPPQQQQYHQHQWHSNLQQQYPGGQLAQQQQPFSQSAQLPYGGAYGGGGGGFEHQSGSGGGGGYYPSASGYAAPLPAYGASAGSSYSYSGGGGGGALPPLSGRQQPWAGANRPYVYGGGGAAAQAAGGSSLQLPDDGSAQPPPAAPAGAAAALQYAAAGGGRGSVGRAGSVTGAAASLYGDGGGGGGGLPAGGSRPRTPASPRV